MFDVLRLCHVLDPRIRGCKKACGAALPHVPHLLGTVRSHASWFKLLG